MSTAKEKYIAFSKDNYVPLFFRDYYLDAVCDSPWDVVLYEEADKVKAAHLYMLKQKAGLKYIIQPQLCPYTGPIFFDTSNAEKVYKELIARLPSCPLVIQDYIHGIPDFGDAEKTTQEKHTYIIDSKTEVDPLWNLQSSTHRRIIRKAERELTYEEEADIEVFLDFVSKTFQTRNKVNPNNPEVFRRLDQVLAQRGQRKIVKCTNKNDLVVAMCYFQYDEQWTYNFANSVVEDYKHYGMNLILWNEIKEALSNGRSFDFEGSMIPGIDAFFSRFKGIKTYYQSRYKSSNKLVDFMVKLKTSKIF